jgi:hypothetical protein
LQKCRPFSRTYWQRCRTRVTPLAAAFEADRRSSLAGGPWVRRDPRAALRRPSRLLSPVMVTMRRPRFAADISKRADSFELTQPVAVGAERKVGRGTPVLRKSEHGGRTNPNQRGQRVGQAVTWPGEKGAVASGRSHLLWGTVRTVTSRPQSEHAAGTASPWTR